ncbi:hypothetical protein A5761_14140 [Mycolicibacterium setense]|uniref:Uncharacterized protein n=1 Tax=Mycolicibacterium setense TaxID=431269 RepID=A0ABR4YSK7_9MYCO|nr:hypothetical protein QQ25_21345 [Mycolicibacterium setense]KHO23978.1 hypothetical protein QQ44_17650 [Mycolicibacterium setense]OBB15243.1 hypothetical protein A5761_14140 [Mycolicibacterium setense]
MNLRLSWFWIRMAGDASWSPEANGSKESVATNHEPVAFRFGEQPPNSCRRIPVQLKSSNL